ncbi:uncharacterized protein LOC131231899 isoform X2 [Magnolia sinica]|uniref:uncharacterized protein LOC131231899 isoform X2 n=1 Tax=Magnolia sinica TaxID=86752 RepID=UPI0026594871|nr:uncharacterized protein LOC131231899 isoform X2 [Magnolia sinica]
MEMLENEGGRHKSGTMTGTLEDICSIPSERAIDRLTYKLVRVEEDGSIFPALEDEVMDVDHLLAEPKNEKFVEDDVLCLNSDNPVKCLAMEDFPCPDDYCQRNTDSGMLGSVITREGKLDSKFEFIDGMLQGVDEQGSLHVTSGLSSDCAEYLFDTGFVEESSHLDYAPRGGLCLGDLGTGTLSPGLSERDNDPAGTSNFSSAIVPLPESTSDQSTFLLENMTIRELHEAFRSTFGRETSVKDKQWLKRRILFGLQNLIELDNGCSLLQSGLSSHDNEDEMIFTSADDSSQRIYHPFTDISGNKAPPLGRDAGREGHTSSDALASSIPESGKIGFEGLNFEDRENAFVSRKRLRKPTRRYIEESSDVTSRTCSGRLEIPTMSLTDKFQRAKSHNQHHRKGFGSMLPVSRQDSFGGSSIQVPFGLRVRRGRPRKNSTSPMGHDSKDYKEYRLLSGMPKRNCGFGSPQSESHDDMSDDCAMKTKTEKSGMRRKHHRLWNLSEVMKLVEGVSRYGVGRWTDIKRLLFSSSAHRTSVDLKDKWRNLLRASCVPMQSKKEVEQRKKHASLPIPPAVLRRVRELAVIYPYPRERKSKLPRAAAPLISAASSDPSVSRSGRIVHRKNFMSPSQRL